MKNILLIAHREFRQIAATKSFWLTLLLLPLALALGPILAEYFDEDEATRIVLLDKADGTAGEAIRARFALEEDRRVLTNLSRYVRRHSLERADPAAPWAQHDRWYSDAEVAAYQKTGGLSAALAQIAQVRPADVPAFEPPSPLYAFEDASEELRSAGNGAALETAANSILKAEPDGKGVEAVLVIGSRYPANPTVRLFASDQPRSNFVATVQDVLTADLRARTLTAQGISPDTARAVQTAAPSLSISTPPPGDGAGEVMLIRSIIPLALSYLLMMSLILSGSWMLQSSVEERSNKLLEALLACVRPEELMYGKLLGTLAIGFAMILVWFACAALTVAFSQSIVGDYIRPALAPLNSAGSVLTIVYFFIAGYIMVSIIFVTIGAISDSMSNAQGYLMPVLLLILLPITLLIQAILAGEGGAIVQVLTWIPLWTPFTVLARLGTGIEWWEIGGSGTLLAVFILAEFVLLGRLFRASLLAQGQTPTMRQLYQRVQARG